MSMNKTSSIILQFVDAQPFDVNILVFPNNPPVHTLSDLYNRWLVQKITLH